jgi:hypothetical protein
MNMREAFEKWWHTVGLQVLFEHDEPISKVSTMHIYKAGYAAAIEAVKAGGPVAWRCVENGHLFRQEFPSTEPLFRLPEDV